VGQGQTKPDHPTLCPGGTTETCQDRDSPVFSSKLERPAWPLCYSPSPIISAIEGNTIRRKPTLSPTTSLRAIKSIHTLAWVFFVACILVIPVFASRDQFGSAFAFAGIVLVEAAVLVANRWRCPLTDVAARYTDDRRDNFDTYLPLWLARYNKLIFGWLFAGILLFTLLL
jgi:hypothetical protein